MNEIDKALLLFSFCFPQKERKQKEKTASKIVGKRAKKENLGLRSLFVWICWLGRYVAARK
jgi:hypothetical protein